ncbi:MAG: AMIN domain-containing protein [Sulfurimonas sp.]|nr:AMIN domain-containing protein [Sulfurimonas sp.]
MIKIFVISLILVFSLQARQNPFFPSVGEQDLTQTSNKDTSVPLLKRAAIKLPSRARVLKKVSVTYKSLDGSIETKSIDLNKAVDWHLPIFISQSMGEVSTKEIPKKQKKISYKQIFKSKHLSFYKNSKELKIITNDKVIRNFLLASPHRIVIDFKRSTNLKSIIKNIDKSIFKKISLGTHKDYYRAVVELDGKYRYKMEKISNGYLFKLR